MGHPRRDPKKLALADALSKQGFTHGQIAEQVGCSRANVTYMLNRKNNPFPEVVRAISAKIVERSINAAQRAIAKELRQIAAEMDRSI